MKWHRAQMAAFFADCCPLEPCNLILYFFKSCLASIQHGAWHMQPAWHICNGNPPQGQFLPILPYFTTILPWPPTAAGRNFCHWVAHNFPKTENRCLAVPDWPIVLAQRSPLCFVFCAGPTMGPTKPKFSVHRAPEPCNAIFVFWKGTLSPQKWQIFTIFSTKKTPKSRWCAN